MKKKSVIIAGLISVILVVGFLLVTQPFTNKLSPGEEAMSYMNKHGIIQDKKAWENLMESTDRGKNIKTSDDLNFLLQKTNRHSSAQLINLEDISNIEHKNLPTSKEFKNFTLISVPNVYSTEKDFLEEYTKELAQLIEKSSENIVLNLANNYGGNTEAMIIGASGLIPDGLLYYERDNQDKKFEKTLKNGVLSGGVPETLSEGLESFDMTPKKQLEKKVIVLTNNHTMSASEFLLVSLLNNANVKSFGMPTTGMTSSNTNQVIPISDEEAWWVVYTIGYIETKDPIKGETVFNNQPISPDVVFDLSSMFDGGQDLTTLVNYDELIEALDREFLEK